MTHASDDEQRMAEAVLRYLTDRPEAMDTIEGIAEWWITREQIRTDVMTLSRVLDHLTDEGILERIPSRGHHYYHLIRDE